MGGSEVLSGDNLRFEVLVCRVEVLDVRDYHQRVIARKCGLGSYAL